MNIRDINKLLEAGFMLIGGERTDRSGDVIKAMTAEKPHWHIIERFKTIRDTRARLLELVNDKNIIDLYDSARHYRRTEEEKQILFYGYSDDMMVVEDELIGANEYSQFEGDIKHAFEIRSGNEVLLVHPLYLNGCWSFAISQVSEDTPLPDWWSRLWNHPFDRDQWKHRRWARNSQCEMPTYSTVLQIDAPMDAVVTWKGNK